MKLPPRGFTLIELLVVIAIIGILSSVVLASVNSARTKANDTKRKAELVELQKALDIYYIDKGMVPGNPSSGSWSTADAALQALVTGGYIGKIPVSADSSQPYYYYEYGAVYMVASYIGDKYGPGTQGWHCSDAASGTVGSRYWCLESYK